MWIVTHEDLKTSPRCRAVFDALVEGMGGKLDNSGCMAAESGGSAGDSHSAKIAPM